MMIGRFHKLIQSRLLWAVFLVVIVFSFVIWGMQGPERGRGEDGSVSGRLDGRPVTREEFTRAEQFTDTSLSLLYGPLPSTDEVAEIVRRMAWERLARLRLAEEIGIRVTNQEVLQALSADPSFRRDGRFDPGLYKTQVTAFMNRAGRRPRTALREFEETVRQDLALERLAGLVGGGLAIPRHEVERRLAAITDRFDLHVVRIPAAILPPVPEPTEEELVAFHAAHSHRYRVPEERHGRKARFAPLPAAADGPAPDEYDLRDYFDDHPGEFWIPPDPEDDEAGPPRRMTFEEARPEIAARILRETAVLRARRRAERFLEAVAPVRRDALAADFGEAALEHGAELLDFGPVTARSAPGTGGLSGPALRALFDLAPDEPASRVIDEGETFAVLTVTRRDPPRDPDLEEVRDLVAAGAREAARDEALAREARRLAEAAAESGLEEAAAARGLEGERIESFSGMSAQPAPEGLPVEALLHAVRDRSPGEITDPVDAGDDGLFLAQVLRREPAPEAELDPLRPQVAAMLRNQWGEWLNRDLTDALLAPGRFVPFQDSHDSGD